MSDGCVFPEGKIQSSAAPEPQGHMSYPSHVCSEAFSMHETSPVAGAQQPIQMLESPRMGSASPCHVVPPAPESSCVASMSVVALYFLWGRVWGGALLEGRKKDHSNREKGTGLKPGRGSPEADLEHKGEWLGQWCIKLSHHLQHW